LTHRCNGTTDFKVHSNAVDKKDRPHCHVGTQGGTQGGGTQGDGSLVFR
jgi:hypothetical protein